MSAFSHARTIIVLCTMFLPFHGAAAELAAPQGDVILTVTGAIEQTNVGKTAAFDIEMLEALPVEEISTSTIWTDGTNQFSGVSLKTLLEHVGARGNALEAIAINDYKVTIPIEDAVIDGPIIAHHLNSEKMSVRERGPLWIIYPYDKHRKYRSEVIYSRSIWQLKSIHVLE